MSGYHKIAVVKSRGFHSLTGDEPIHTNIYIVPDGEKIVYSEFDIEGSAKVIEINSDVKFPYVSAAIKRITNAGENTSPSFSQNTSYFFDVNEYENLLGIIENNKEKVEAVKDIFDLDNNFPME